MGLKKNNFPVLGLGVFLTIFILIFFQNCSKSKFPVSKSEQQSSSLYLGNDPNFTFDPPPDCQTPECLQKEKEATALLYQLPQKQNNSSCLTNTTFNACLFYKNPVAARGRAFTAMATNSDNLSAFQNLGVRIDSSTFDSATGCLKNKDYQIVTNTQYKVDSMTGLGSISGELACFPSRQFKVSYDGTDYSHKLAQISPHYFLNLQKKFMTEWTGIWYASNKAIPVYSFLNNPDVNNNAFFGSAQVGTSKVGYILLPAWDQGTTKAGTYQETALSAEAYLHEAGHANLFFASDPKPSPLKNRDCTIPDSSLGTRSASSTVSCCSSAEGCSKAIDEGLADYHAIMMFPDIPVIGESLFNDINGSYSFNTYRNYSKLKDLMPDVAFERPTDNRLNGEIHLMGLIWGSIWFESRLQAKLQFGNRGVRALDQLFTRHLLLIDGESTFKTLCQETVNEASAIESGLVQEVFKNECQRRGLIP